MVPNIGLLIPIIIYQSHTLLLITYVSCTIQLDFRCLLLIMQYIDGIITSLRLESSSENDSYNLTYCQKTQCCCCSNSLKKHIYIHILLHPLTLQFFSMLNTMTQHVVTLDMAPRYQKLAIRAVADHSSSTSKLDKTLATSKTYQSTPTSLDQTGPENAAQGITSTGYRPILRTNSSARYLLEANNVEQQPCPSPKPSPNSSFSQTSKNTNFIKAENTESRDRAKKMSDKERPASLVLHQEVQPEPPKNKYSTASPLSASLHNSPIKYLKNIANYQKLDSTIDKKIVLNHNTRPSTPHKLSSQQNSKWDFSCTSSEEDSMIQGEIQRLGQQEQKQRFAQELQKTIQSLTVKNRELDLMLCQKNKQIQKFKVDIQVIRKQKNDKEMENLTLRAELQKNNPNTYLAETRKLQEQNMGLKMEIVKLNSSLSHQTVENTLLAKTVKSHLNAIQEMERNRVRDLQIATEQWTSDKVASLEKTIQELKEEIARYRDSESLKIYSRHQTELPNKELEEFIMKMAKELEYYRIRTHCLQRKIANLQSEARERISPEKYTFARNELRAMSSKYRQTLTKLRLVKQGGSAKQENDCRRNNFKNSVTSSKPGSDMRNKNSMSGSECEEDEDSMERMMFELTPQK